MHSKKKEASLPPVFLHCIARLVARGHRDKNPAKNGKHRLLFLLHKELGLSKYNAFSV